MIPIRCFSCGKPIAHLHEEYTERSANEDKKKIFEDLGISRFCCRQTFLSHVSLFDMASKFKKN